MDFQFSPDDAAFRKEIRSFIQGRLPSDWDTRALDEEESFEFGRENALAIQRDDSRKWLTMAWPKEYGGQAASHWRQMIWNWEQAYWRFPISVGAGISLAGPSIMIHGTDEQKTEWLPRIASADEVWCQ
ncbi:MAG: acyl-CoA dehydrogenase family protein, partial [Chloroflexi bacterium]|nr:acyl-CoA dehydrogenase family protein [Chloroflexota bacterium]